MEKVLVAGATGKTGQKVMGILKDNKNYEPIALVRHEAQKQGFKKKNIDCVVGDLEEDLSHVTEDFDKIIFAAGSRGERLYEVDQEGAKRLIDIGKKANIDKFVMLSSMGADEPRQSSELYKYFQAKHSADEYLKASLLPFTIVRPGSLSDEAGTGKVAVAPKFSRRGSVSRDDVAKTLVASLPNEISRDRSFEVLAGPTLIEEAVLKA